MAFNINDSKKYLSTCFEAYNNLNVKWREFCANLGAKIQANSQFISLDAERFLVLFDGAKIELIFDYFVNPDGKLQGRGIFRYEYLLPNLETEQKVLYEFSFKTNGEIIREEARPPYTKDDYFAEEVLLNVIEIYLKTVKCPS